MKPASILVVEDEILIAMDLEQTLLDMGFEECVLVSSSRQAERWLAQHRPIFAVLDIQLRGGSCEAVAHQLVALGIPFIVSSGSHVEDHDTVFARGAHVPKPCTARHLADALRLLGVAETTPNAPRHD